MKNHSHASRARPIAIMPLSRMENTTFAMPSIIDSHDMGLRNCLQSRRPKENAYSTHRWAEFSRVRATSNFF
ncbi:hypothetical protein TNCV_4766071 [Trichonephila clavipes]|nr:hypothetical protein TNCV_4766071 [Trichonephila clavipes]